MTERLSVLIDPGRYVGILFLDNFERLRMDIDDLKALKCLLVGFLGKKVQLKNYITLKTIFGTE